jgi:hypothetical protein
MRLGKLTRLSLLSYGIRSDISSESRGRDQLADGSESKNPPTPAYFPPLGEPLGAVVERALRFAELCARCRSIPPASPVRGMLTGIFGV